MAESIYTVLPWVAASAFVVVTLLMALGLRGSVGTSWTIPAALAMLFAFWTCHAARSEGVTGFWIEHIRNAWGNQIWFDLLLAIATAWILLLPRARAIGMRPLPWLVLIVCTGSIGLLAMVARCLFLESRKPAA
jgi:hypothetical protein